MNSVLSINPQARITSENIKSLGIYFKYKKRNSMKPSIRNKITILFKDHEPEGKIKLKNFCIKANITK